MELVQFYLHLPSNSSLDKFPNNSLTEYRVGLPQTVSLAGDWEVGLTEIRYPHTCNNVQGNFQDLFSIRNQELSGVWDNEKCFNDDVRFLYDALSRKVTVHLQNNAELFFGDVGYLLGFSLKEVISQTSTAKRESDLDHGFHDLYIYCDIIQPQYVGDALVPLFRIVPVEGKDGQRVNKSFLHPQYVPVSRKQFEMIKVIIKRDIGETVPFEFGRVLLTLHFRQSRPMNF